MFLTQTYAVLEFTESLFLVPVFYFFLFLRLTEQIQLCLNLKNLCLVL